MHFPPLSVLRILHLFNDFGCHANMHSSMFNYAVSRPYPVRWFTPVVFVGGTIALVLFSFLNFVATGYYQR